ncbi:MAG TPA: AEC family transporter [Marinobacterium sp.]|nr:AEC family transporter [Marinobacterium sp.]
MNIIASLGPVFVLLMGGYLLKRTGFPGDSFWPSAERFIYFICFPALLLTRLAEARFEGQLALDLVWVILMLLVAGALLLLLLQKLNGFTGPVFTSVFQGGIRFNTYIALAIAAGILPGQGVVYAAIIASVMIPLINVFCVLVFATYQDNRPSPARVLLNIVQNPLILSCILGLILNLSGVVLPDIVGEVLSLLAEIALPLGLLAVGAALQIKTLRSTGLPLLTALLFRLLVMPMLAIASASAMQLPLEATQILLVFAAVPSATASYILARQLGGDAPLMAAILSGQTLVAMLSLPLVLAFGVSIYPHLLSAIYG